MPSASAHVRHFRKLLAILLILLMQGPAALVQEVAWAGMLWTYTQERGFKRGVIETFDGGHPCALCHKAEEIHQQEQRPDGGDPRMPERSPRLAWADMTLAESLRMPPIIGSDLIVLQPALAACDAARRVDAPGLPPPERA